MSKDFRDFKFRFWFKISKGHFPINKIVKFRSANGIDLFIIGLKLSWGMPYLHRYIYEQGYDAGFRRD